jgi:putative glutamine amidotransferase
VVIPLIAVPAQPLRPGRVGHWESGAFGVPDTYVDALRRAGARPVVLTEPDEADPREILEPFDGLLLLGGGDVEPSRYGAAPHAESYGVEPARDELEIALVRTADEIGMPTLAICRGIQVMNVAFGGSLIQHLPDVDALAPHGPPLGGRPVMHEVKVAPETRLLATCGSQTLACSSHHHQGIDRLGRGLSPTAWSEDGLVEAVERPTGWMIGVQWHPEETAPEDPAQQAMFDGLTVVARWGASRARPAREGRTREYEIVEYDAAWPERFEQEAARIREALGDVAVRIEHVGSTAVPGLVAKPTIDIQVSIASMEPRAAYVEPLAGLGYRFVIDPERTDHEYFSRDDNGVRSHHVHVCLAGSKWERDHLAFRDHLRDDADTATEYGRLKRELANLHSKDLYTYVGAKTRFIETVVERARGGG